jgi:hypothetical protein
MHSCQPCRQKRCPWREESSGLTTAGAGTTVARADCATPFRFLRGSELYVVLAERRKRLSDRPGLREPRAAAAPSLRLVRLGDARQRTRGRRATARAERPRRAHGRSRILTHRRSRPGALLNGVDWTHPSGSYRSCLPGHATIWIVHRSSHRFELVRYAYGIVK